MRQLKTYSYLNPSESNWFQRSSNAAKKIGLRGRRCGSQRASEVEKKDKSKALKSEAEKRRKEKYQKKNGAAKIDYATIAISEKIKEKRNEQSNVIDGSQKCQEKVDRANAAETER